MNKILEHLRKNWIRHGFETVVVVVGVLGAYSLNNWNEHRKDRVLEREYLLELKSDFEVNLEVSETIIQSEEILIEKADLLLSVLNSESDFEINEVVLALEIAGYNPEFFARSAAWQELVSTGNQLVISNKDLTHNISDYFHRIEFFDADEFDNYKLWYREAILGVLNSRLRMEANDLWAGWQRNHVPPSAAELKSDINAEEVLKRMHEVSKLEAIITDIRMFRRVNIFMLKAVQETNNKILKEIEQELSK